MLSRIVAQILMSAAQVVGRSFAQALKQEFVASQAAAQRAGGGAQGAKTAANDAFTGMTVSEAKQILNVTDVHDVQKLQTSYEHLFKQNDKTTGGSLYLQSKVVRAKERIDEELSQKASGT